MPKILIPSVSNNPGDLYIKVTVNDKQTDVIRGEPTDVSDTVAEILSGAGYAFTVIPEPVIVPEPASAQTAEAAGGNEAVQTPATPAEQAASVQPAAAPSANV